MHNNLDYLENQLLRYTGLNISQFSRKFVELQGGEIIYVLECGNINLPPLILLHGYGSMSSFFYKILGILVQKYRVICMDLRGFGRSSRPPFTCQTCQETEEFFVSALENIIDQQKIQFYEFKKFYLAGHSLGGYVSMVYALKHPEKVQKLILLSPLGFRVKPPNYQWEN